jgi:hypothetical protein
MDGEFVNGLLSVQSRSMVTFNKALCCHRVVLVIAWQSECSPTILHSVLCPPGCLACCHSYGFATLHFLHDSTPVLEPCFNFLIDT